MFIGHFGVGFGAKKVARSVSLGTLFLAAQFVDLLWPTLLLFGVERVEIEPGITKLTPLNFVYYPYTHSLLMGVIWGLLLGGIYWMVRKNRRGAVVVGLLVLSHWILDLVVHRPDLPLYPGGAAHVGFGLWNSVPGTLLVEGLIFVIGVWMYTRATEARNKRGTYGFWGLVLFLVLVHASNVAGPPPPSVTAIAWAGQLQWLIVLWGYWVDRNREARPAMAATAR